MMDAYGERLTKLAFNYVKEWSLAQDVVQDVFVRCYTKYDSIGEIQSVKAWLFRLTINQCKDVIKSASFKRNILGGSLFHKTEGKDTSPEITAIKRNEDEVLSQCVLNLPIKYREVILLFYYEELSLEEICQLLTLNTNTVKTRLRRGRKKLKTALERSGIDGR
ncbi:sigma-70 family RNA polymerase sigma factor [Bacillus tamaricis]|uniref:Sigma-70 family RNA polymerase sigma factor n=2 Tax=Evansella tamaricis TaxID=2069301 RepID=A0ABS6JA79_9BACI|nr:sigma-70 family RNA polymerase sigma factor [Evansella tamaricis]